MKRTLLTLLLIATTACATVTTLYEPEYFNCNGSVTDFVFTFRVEQTTDVDVYLRIIATGVETKLTLNSDYSLSATNNDYSGGGTVTTVSAYSSAYQIIIGRSTELTQEAQFVNNKALENTLDRSVMSTQEVQSNVGRSLRAPIGDESPNMELPSSVERAGGRLGFDETTGDVTIITGDVQGAAVSAFMETMLDDSTAAIARTTLGVGSTDTVTIADLITKGPWADVRAYGAVGDGTTDDSSAFTAAIAAASSDGVIYIPAGTFLINSAVTINKSLIIAGTGKASIIKVGFDGRVFIVSAGTNLVLQDFVIDGDSTGTGFSITANLELLRVERVTFHDTANNYCINAASGTDIDRIEIIGCTIKDCLNGMRFAGECVSAYVGHNLVDTLTGTSAVIGFQLGHNTEAMQESQRRYIVEDNIFLDITTTGVDAEAHAVLLYGRDAIIRNNIIDTVTNHATSSQGAEAIYIKAKFTTISGNVIIDGGASDNGVIAIKGASRAEAGGVKSFATFITDNILIESAVTTDIGIYISSDDCFVANNYFENLDGSAIRTPVKVLDNISIINNRIITHQGTRAIRISHSGEGLRINGNFIFEPTSFGIAIQPQVGFLEDVEINNNTITGTSADNVKRGIYILADDAPGRIKGLEINNNHISLVSTTQDVYGISIDMTAADDVAIAQFVVKDNDYSRLAGHNSGGTRPMFFTGTSELKISDFIVRDNFFYGPYQNKTANFDVEFEYSGDLFTNNGSSGTITGILPVGQPGLIFSFAAVDDYDLRIDPDGTDAIIGGSGAGKYISLDTLGDTVTLECVIANEWIIKAGYGTYGTE